jgi:hypothetical protein
MLKATQLANTIIGARRWLVLRLVNSSNGGDCAFDVGSGFGPAERLGELRSNSIEPERI